MPVQHIDENEFDGKINVSGFFQAFRPLINGLKIMSATVPKSQVELVQQLTDTDPWMANIGASDAIESGDILPLKATYIKVEDKRDVKTIVRVCDIIISQNDQKVPCKCLVNETTVKNLTDLKDQLILANIAVFWTTAETGKKSYIAGVEKTYNSIHEFADAVNNYAGNCVVLHIKQVIAGVDISGLTHCLIRNCENTQADTVRMIQTIGRTLRYANAQERISRQNEIRTQIAAKLAACV